MKKLYALLCGLSLVITSSLCLTTPVYAESDTYDFYTGKEIVLSVTQDYFPKWIQTKVIEGFEFAGIETYGKTKFAIHLQEELPEQYEYGVMNYYLLGDLDQIERIETDIYSPTPYLDVPEDKGKAITIERIRLLEKGLSKLTGVDVQLTDRECTSLAEYALKRENHVITKADYKIEVIDKMTKTYNDYRPNGFANIGMTLQGSAKIKVDKSLGSLPSEAEAMALLKKMPMTEPDYTRSIKDYWLFNSRKISFKTKESLPTGNEPKLYCFEVNDWMDGQEVEKPSTWKVEPSYVATWAVKKEAFFDHFESSIAKIQSECLEVAKLAGVNGKASDLKQGLESARSWVEYRKENPNVPAYNYQQHSFPKDFNDDDQYDFTLQVEMNDDKNYVIVRIYFG